MANSTYMKILEAVQDVIQGLSLTDIDDASVIVVKVPSQRKGALPALPGVVICPFNAKGVDANAGTNASDDIEYPVLIATIAASNQDPTSNMDRELLWHEQILSAFINQRLTGVTTVMRCTVSPQDTFNPAAWFAGYDAGGMILRFLSRELRA